MIKEKRNSMHYTQEEMANKLGISLRQYVRIDNEQAFPRRDILSKLIFELELTNEEIRKEIEEVKNTIRNEEILIGITDYAEENIKQFEAYIEKLEEMLSDKKN